MNFVHILLFGLILPPTIWTDIHQLMNTEMPNEFLLINNEDWAIVNVLTEWVKGSDSNFSAYNELSDYRLNGSKIKIR